MNSTDTREMQKLQDILREAPHGSVVFFGGAGVSTESGIPDFRSSDGLYAQKYPYPPETMISRSFFDSHTPEFFNFYFDRMIYADAKPNQTHKKLAELEANGTLISVITQNIDGLHQAAGSKRVHELHGSVLRNYCMNCSAHYDLQAMLELRAAANATGKAEAETEAPTDGTTTTASAPKTTPTSSTPPDDVPADGVPRCPKCGGIVKPDVVLYEEPLNSAVLESAMHDIARASILVVAGTSLVVNPAASLIRYFNGSHLAIVNLSPTPADNFADIVVARPVGEVFNF